MKKDRRDFLLEINTEELPAGYVAPALRELRLSFLKEFENARISYGREENLAAGGTENSLVFFIRDLSVKQETASERIWGPPKSVAFDEKGLPTRQAIGFAKNQGVRVEDLKIEAKDPKGLNPYVVIDKKLEARGTTDILKEIIPDIIKNIHFPKTMRWDDSGLRFARPIESVLALFGKDNVSIKIGNVEQKKTLNIPAGKYWKGINKKYLIKPEDRKKEIERQVLKELKKLKADKAIDKNLLDEVNFLVTSPVIFVGTFDKKFLSLPEDVLKASMSKYQRLFPVSKNGRLVNRFIAVLDGPGRDIKAVRKNYESILEARLKDSLFFFDEDTKKPLSENIPHLKDLIFQKDLGNMFEKIQRLKVLSAFICERIGADGSLKKDVEKAAELSKADLVTHMVGEFPSLQGIMGREYALKSGEKKEIATAIGEHYLPQGADDSLPKSLGGAVLALTDKIDNVVGFLGMGAETSGSFDPFGIRRNAQGFIQIIREKSFRFDINESIEKSIELYGDKVKIPAVQLKNKIINYIKDRIEFLVGKVSQIELKETVLSVAFSDIADTFNRIDILLSIRKERYFLEAAKVVERTSNILKGAKGEKIGKVDAGLFREDPERRVWQAYLDSKDKIQDLIDREQYKEATREYAAAFYKVLHDFFDKVLVNTEDKALRLNRLALMKAINALYAERIANLAMLPQIVVK